MSEAFVWKEGALYVWTGSATASALIGDAQNSQDIRQRGWLDHQTVSGEYAEHLTGRRIAFSFQRVYAPDAGLLAMLESETAVHLHFKQSHIKSSAGLYVWTAYIDTISDVGSDGNPFVVAVNGHGHRWSAYGG